MDPFDYSLFADPRDDYDPEPDPDDLLEHEAQDDLIDELAAEAIRPMTYLIADETGAEILVTWTELAEVNDPETMDEIERIEVGERTILGMCAAIERVS